MASRIIKAVILLALAAGCASAAQWRLVFEGDSITQGSGANYPDMGGYRTNSYSRWLTNYFWSCSDISGMFNVGVSSSKVADCANHYTNASISNVQQYKPAGGTNAMLFLEVGVNNISFLEPATAAALWGEYSNYLYRARSDGFTTVAFTCTTNTGWGAPSRAIAVEFREILLTNHPAVFDYLIDAASVLPDGTDTQKFVDGLHWSLLGHKIIATNVASIINLCGSASPHNVIGISGAFSVGGSGSVRISP